MRAALGAASLILRLRPLFVAYANVSGRESASSPEPSFAQTQKQLVEFCAHVREEKAFAFDTEFVMEDRYKSELCLVQLATRDAVCLVDPQEGLELAPVWELVCDPGIEIIVHDRAGGSGALRAAHRSGSPPGVRRADRRGPDRA